MTATLKEKIGDIEPGHIFYISEFNDGQIYWKDFSGITKLLEFSTLKDAVSKSVDLSNHFNDELLAKIELQRETH